MQFLTKWYSFLQKNNAIQSLSLEGKRYTIKLGGVESMVSMQLKAAI